MDSSLDYCLKGDVHDVIVISQYEWVILVITQVRGKAEDEGNN